MDSDRLISAERLVIKLAKKNRFGRIEYDDIMAVIAEAPTVDAVEVVRCKDCKYRYTPTALLAYRSVQKNLEWKPKTMISVPTEKGERENEKRTKQ